MTRHEAIRITKKGYRFGVIGLILGYMLSFSYGPIVILLWGYALWALFHGMQLIIPLINNLYEFGPVHLRVTRIHSLFEKSIQLKLMRIFLILIGGYVIGVCGGAILRQLYLWMIISNSH